MRKKKQKYGTIKVKKKETKLECISHSWTLVTTYIEGIHKKKIVRQFQCENCKQIKTEKVNITEVEDDNDNMTWDYR